MKTDTRDLSSRTQRIATRILGSIALLAILTAGPRTVFGHPPAETDPVLDATLVAALEARTADDPPTVMWDVLIGLDLKTGEPSDDLAPFIGKEVRVPGFMVPLEDWAGEASEFLLVPYVGACIHTPPPPPNQLVYVEMEDGEKVKIPLWDPVWIHGVLELEETTNVYGSVSFKMTGTEVVPYEY